MEKADIKMNVSPLKRISLLETLLQYFLHSGLLLLYEWLLSSSSSEKLLPSI